MASARAAATTRLHRWRLPGLAFAVSLVLSVLAWQVVGRETRHSESVRFDRLTDRVTATVLGRFASAAQALHSARALLWASEDVSPQEWAIYVAATSPYFNEGVVGLGLVERVPRAEVGAL